MKQLCQYTDAKYIKELSTVRKYDAIDELAAVFEGRRCAMMPLFWLHHSKSAKK